MTTEKKMPEALRNALIGRTAMLDFALQQGNTDAAMLILDRAIRDSFSYGMQHVKEMQDLLVPTRTIFDNVKVYEDD